MDLRRLKGKFKKAHHNYQFNTAPLAGPYKRHENLLQKKATILEKRNTEEAKLRKREGNTIAKRAAGSTVALTDYCSLMLFQLWAFKSTDHFRLISDAGGRDSMWFGNLGIGTAAQTFVPSASNPTSHTKFQISESSTIQTSSAEWDIEYGSGTSRGVLARDSVTLAGIVVPSQIFALANQSAPSLEALPSDGILGLGFSTIATSGAPTWFENAITEGLVTSPYFSFYLQRARDLGDSSGTGTVGGGELCVGCTDSSKYTGSITYTSVSTKGYWQVPMDGVAVNGVLVSGTSVSAAIDTGTTLIYLPISAAAALYKSLGGVSTGTTGHYSVPCSATFQTLALSFSGIQYEIPLQDLFLGTASSTNTAQCLLGIFGQDQTDPNGKPVAIVGGLFLKAVYTVFDYSHGGSPAVGFAVSSTSDVSAASSTSSSSGGSSNSTGSGSGHALASTSASVFKATGVAGSIAAAPIATAVSVYSAPPVTAGASSSAAQVFSAPSGAASGGASIGSAAQNTGVATGFAFTVFSTYTGAEADEGTSTASSPGASSSTISSASPRDFLPPLTLLSLALFTALLV
ncbi:hypothetical protein P7C70_g2176, partial [Phenoliferia sp. Uapishka_3]